MKRSADRDSICFVDGNEDPRQELPMTSNERSRENVTAASALASSFRKSIKIISQNEIYQNVDPAEAQLMTSASRERHFSYLTKISRIFKLHNIRKLSIQDFQNSPKFQRTLHSLGPHESATDLFREPETLFFISNQNISHFQATLCKKIIDTKFSEFPEISEDFALSWTPRKCS